MKIIQSKSYQDCLLISSASKKKKKGRCWKGYEPTPGKEPYSKGSCRPK